MADEFDRRSDPGYPKTGERRRRRKSNYVGKNPPTMISEKKDEKKFASTSPSKKTPNLRKRKILQSRLDERKLELNRRRNMLIRAKKNTQRIEKPSASMMMDTTTSAYGDAGRGRPVPKFKEGGVCKGAGAAIKGTNFKGVF